jgi:GNAT superfamily N-acetyltransferase
MKFRRGVDTPAEAATSLRVERISAGGADHYGAVVAKVFTIGSPLERWFAALCTRPGWGCFGAFDGDRLVGTAAMYVAAGLGWLGVAGTLPEARGRGGQSALLAARIRAAGDAGARLLATETVERTNGEAGASFRNVLRAGFTEAYVQQWWVLGE